MAANRDRPRCGTTVAYHARFKQCAELASVEYVHLEQGWRHPRCRKHKDAGEFPAVRYRIEPVS